jgi:hypothetical protein
MAKKTYKNVDGTSFQDVTIKASVQDLTRVLGEPDNNNTGEDKVNFVWDLETEEGDVFTIYDWKEYRMIDVNEKIEWHIGANSKMASWDAKDEITRELSN